MNLAVKWIGVLPSQGYDLKQEATTEQKEIFIPYYRVPVFLEMRGVRLIR